MMIGLNTFEEERKVNLTKYTAKAVRQLLNGNPKIAKMLPTATENEILDFLNKNYILTKEQIDFYITNL